MRRIGAILSVLLLVSSVGSYAQLGRQDTYKVVDVVASATKKDTSYSSSTSNAAAAKAAAEKLAADHEKERVRLLDDLNAINLEQRKLQQELQKNMDIVTRIQGYVSDEQMKETPNAKTLEIASEMIRQYEDKAAGLQLQIESGMASAQEARAESVAFNVADYTAAQRNAFDDKVEGLQTLTQDYAIVTYENFIGAGLSSKLQSPILHSETDTFIGVNDLAQVFDITFTWELDQHKGLIEANDLAIAMDLDAQALTYDTLTKDIEIRLLDGTQYVSAAELMEALGVDLIRHDVDGIYEVQDLSVKSISVKNANAGFGQGTGLIKQSSGETTGNSEKTTAPDMTNGVDETPAVYTDDDNYDDDDGHYEYDDDEEDDDDHYEYDDDDDDDDHDDDD